MSNNTKALLSVILSVSVIASGCNSRGPATDLSVNATEGINVGNRAIDFELQTIDGKTVKLSDYRGKPILLNFWATWCEPCRYEMPFLQQINDTYSSKGLVLLAVDLTYSLPTETPETVQKFIATFNLTLTVLMDSDKTMAKAYLLTSIPTTFLIDKDGIIRGKVIGAFADKAAIENALKTIMPWSASS